MLVLSKAPEFQKGSEEKDRILHEKSLFIILSKRCLQNECLVTRPAVTHQPDEKGRRNFFYLTLALASSCTGLSLVISWVEDNQICF